MEQPRGLEYSPTLTEVRVAAAVFALGFLVFTLMLKVAVPILLGELQEEKVDRAAQYATAAHPIALGH